MTKSEIRKARKASNFSGECALDKLDKDNESIEFSPERNRNRKPNLKRARALQNYARFVYEHDRD